MSKLKILHIFWRPFIAGGEQFVLSLAKLHGQKHEIAVCFLGEEAPLLSEFRKLGLAVEIIGMRHGFDLWTALRLYSYLKINTADIIHVHSPNFLLNFCMRFFKNTPKLITEHGGERLVEKLWKGRLLYKIFAANYKKIIAPSQGVKAALIKKIGLRSEMIEVIACGVDLNKFKPVYSIEKKREIGINPEAQVVGFVGRLVKEKGLQYFINAAKHILKDLPEVEFVIMGDGPLMFDLKQQAAKSALAGKIKFLGFRSDIPELLSILDIFLFPSEHEASPLAVLEAMSTGITVVGFRVEGVQEVVDSGFSGVLVPFGQGFRLAQEVVALLKDDDLRRVMGKNARRRAESMFNIELIAQATEAVYTQLTKNSETNSKIGF